MRFTDTIIENHPRRGWAWRATTLALVAYSLGLALFALLPLLPEPNPLTVLEMFIAGLGFAAGTGLLLRLFLPEPHRYRWGKYAYLLSATAGFITLLAFNVGATEAPVAFRTVFAVFIIAGILSSIGGHLEYGGKPSIEDILSGDDRAVA